MRVAVMGAGAVGCFHGAMLARAGHAVTLVGRARHVDVVAGEGLMFESALFSGRLPVRASTSPEAVTDAELVLFCVKSGDTESAGAELAPHLSDAAVVLSLQNGVDNAERLGHVLDRPVIPAIVYVAAEMAGPGTVRHHGRGELVIGPSPRSGEIAAALAAAGIPTEISPDVVAALWNKLIINCAFNALSAIPRLPYGVLIQAPGVRELMQGVIDECRAVARAAGVAIADDFAAAVQGIAASMATQYSSTAQDLVAGRRSEIDHLNGYIVRRGQALGVATPLNHALHTLVGLMQTARTLPGSP